MGRIADVMTRARAAGWALRPEDAWERSTALAAAGSLERFMVDDLPVGRAIARPAARVPSRHDDHTADVMQLATSAATPMQQYMAALVHRLFLAPERPDDIVRSVVFASVEGGTGSAQLSAASAEMLASAVVGRVCVVDANFGAPSLHRHYGVSNDAGLAQVLTGVGTVRDYARPIAQGPQNTMWLLPAGVSSDASSSLLTAEPNPARFQELMRAFDYVIFEAPPVTQHPAASILGALVDGVVLVAEANVTRRHVARAAADTLRASRARVLGSVLNNRTFPIPEALYRRL